MTLTEWAQVEAFIAAAWPQARPMDRNQVRMRHELVRDVPFAVALDELQRMARAGREWPPNPGQLAAAAHAAARAAAPSVGAVIALLEQAAGAFGARREADALRWLAERSPHAARAACELGWRQFCREQLHDPQVGGAVRQRLERALRGTIAGLERELAEQRVLPLVEDRIRVLETGHAPPSGLRHLRADALLPEQRRLGVAAHGERNDDEGSVTA
jgi:hypothetical protein